MSQPFIIFAKARSRTFWLSKFLTYGQWTCHHDPSGTFSTMNDLNRLLLPGYTGLVDTALALRWRDVVEAQPGAKLVVVRRPIEDCMASLERVGMASERVLTHLRLVEYALGEIVAQVDPMVIDFRSMTAAHMRRLWDHCLTGMPWNAERYRVMEGENLQVDMDAEIRRIVPRYEERESFYGATVMERLEHYGL